MASKQKTGPEDPRYSPVVSLTGPEDEEISIDIDICRIVPFPNHPFRVEEDEEMQKLAKSIRENGVLSPVLVRPAKDGQYQMISGHRRLHAASMAGLDTVPALIRDMDDDEATVFMVDSNIQRRKLSYSEKAFAYKMKMEALKRWKSRKNSLPDHDDPAWVPKPPGSGKDARGISSRTMIASEAGLGTAQISRYIRLTELTPELLKLVDDGKIPMILGVNISYLSAGVQSLLYRQFCETGKIREDQVIALRKLQEKDRLTDEKALILLQNTAVPRTKKRTVSFSERKLNRYFPKNYTRKQMEEVIEALLSVWAEKQREEANK